MRTDAGTRFETEGENDVAKKKKETFDEAGLADVTQRLKQHYAKLVLMLQGCPVNVEFGWACTLRDAADYLVTTCLTIDFIAETLVRLVQMSGQPQSVPHLDGCGLDWNPEESE